MYIVYFLKGARNHLYVGMTKNLENRIKRHIKGDGAEFTKRNKTFSVVYTEMFTTLLEARKREHQVKGWSRIKKENLIKFHKPFLTL